MNVSNVLPPNNDPTASYWEQQIKRTFPNLYPIYKSILLDSPPCRAHYQQLREATACIQAKLDGRPLPSAFKVWKLLNPDVLMSVIVDSKGREIFHVIGEPKNTFAVRLALRTQTTPALPISLRPFTDAIGAAYEPFIQQFDLLHGGLITGIQCDGKTIYLLGELHGVHFYQRVRVTIAQAVGQGKAVAFYEGFARHESAEVRFKQEQQIAPESRMFGLEHPHFYGLMPLFVCNCPANALRSIYWNFQCAPNGLAIWSRFAETFPEAQSSLLQTAFVGQSFHDVLPVEFTRQFDFIEAQHIFKLCAMIVEDVPAHHLLPSERKILMQYFTQPNGALLDSVYPLLHDKRNDWFARNLREKLSTLPEGLPVVAVMGALHHHGVLNHLRNTNFYDSDAQLRIRKQFVNSCRFSSQLHRRVKRSCCTDLTTRFFNPAGLRSRLAETRVNHSRWDRYIQNLVGAAVYVAEGLNHSIYRIRRLRDRVIMSIVGLRSEFETRR